MDQLSLRIRQVSPLLRRAFRHPQWLLATMRMWARRRAESRRSFSLTDHRSLLRTEEEAVTEALGIAPKNYRQARAEFWAPEPIPDEYGAEWDARLELQTLIGTVVRLMRPASIVETGVGRGLTTAVILAALRENGRGRLYSIDLPALVVDERTFVGQLVPEAFKNRWQLVLGPSRMHLAPVIETARPLDIFVHDADHTYESQLEEYTTAWPAIRQGGLLISDDIGNPAFLEFADQVEASPILIGDEDAESAIGVLSRP